MGSFCINVPVGDKEKMEKFQKMMDDLADETMRYCENEAERLGITFNQAYQLNYWRSRSRCTKRVEERLIRLYVAENKGNKTPIL